MLTPKYIRTKIEKEALDDPQEVQESSHTDNLLDHLDSMEGESNPIDGDSRVDLV